MVYKARFSLPSKILLQLQSFPVAYRTLRRCFQPRIFRRSLKERIEIQWMHLNSKSSSENKNP